MKLLLDSHVYLWVADERLSHKLSERLQADIDSTDNEVFVSIVSIWELTIKRMKHGKHFDIDPRILNVSQEFPFQIRSLEPTHIKQLQTLDADRRNPIHRDPFDRIMLAQALSEGLTFVTHDANCLRYNVPGLKLMAA